MWRHHKYHIQIMYKINCLRRTYITNLLDRFWSFPFNITHTHSFSSIYYLHAQNIWLLGLTSTWAHNLFVLWASGFPTVGDPLLGRPKHTSISSSLSLFLTKPLLCFLWVFTLFSQYSSQNCQPPIPHSHLLFIAQD